MRTRVVTRSLVTDDRDLMRIRADTIFTHDEQGRMLCSNEPREAERRPAPRCFLGVTGTGHVLRFGASVPATTARRIDELVTDTPPPTDVGVPHPAVAAICAALSEQETITAEGGGPCYRFPTSVGRPFDVVQLTNNNRLLVRETFPWLCAELADWLPCSGLLRDGAVVSVCFTARRGAVAAEAGVETLVDFRGHGYATAVSAAWGVAIAAEGLIPLYSTAWANLASQGVARRLGLIMFGADTTIT